MPAGIVQLTAADLAPERRPYRPVGAALQLLRCKLPEVLLSGPAGTGKSRACLEKLHIIAENCPRSRSLIVRRTRASITESALVTFEEKVLPANHPVLSGASRAMRQAYRYPNGSQIVIGGLDKPGKVMSTEYDVIFVQEAIELTEDAWEALTTRLRNGVVPYQQLIADTNPDRPTHWLKKRCDATRTLLMESRHEDNPRLWLNGDWTLEGRIYIAKLDALTGPRKQRLRFGRWVQSEGVVYEGWDAAIHLVDSFAVPPNWPRFLSIDFGYTNPFVCQWWAMDPDGRLYLYREIYHTRRLVEDHALRIRELSRDEPAPVAVVCDHDAEGRATLERHLGYLTTPAVKGAGQKTPGIESVAKRLRKAGDGYPRLFVLRNTLDERDADRLAAKKPCCTAEEFDGFVWDTRSGRRSGEVPVKEDDHGMDALRYLVWGLDCVEGAVPDDGEEFDVVRT